MTLAPQSLTGLTLDGGQDTSVTSLIAGAGATSVKLLLVINGAEQPFDYAPSIGYDPGQRLARRC